MKDPKKRVKENFLSFKYCIYLTFMEWLLDLLILPFIIAYLILLPWRFNTLMEVAISQYERVPT